MRARETAAVLAQGGAASDSLVQLCTFRIGGEDYAIDIMRVREIIHPLPITPVPRAPASVEGVVRLRGEVIPVLDARKRLGLEARPSTRKSRFLIVNVARRRIGLVVDEVCEVMRLPRSEIRAAPPLGPPGTPRFFLGVCGGEILPGGRAPRLRLLLNVKALLDPSIPGEADAAKPRAAPDAGEVPLNDQDDAGARPRLPKGADAARAQAEASRRA